METNFNPQVAEIKKEGLTFSALDMIDPIKNEEIEVIKGAGKSGRPTVITKSTLQKLRCAFLMGCSDREACIFAGISFQSLYNYQRNNSEFLEQKEGWKLNTIIIARFTIAKAAATDPNIAWKYLERKLPEEFGSYCRNCKQRIR